jgi:ribosomal protein S20
MYYRGTMAITSSAKKAHKQSLRRHVFNVRRIRAMKEAVKDIEKSTSKTQAEQLLPKVYQAIDKAVKRGVIKANTGARRKAAAAKRVAGMK